MCVEGWRGEGGGLFTTSSQQQVLYLHTFISKTFSRRFFDCQYSFNNSMLFVPIVSVLFWSMLTILKVIRHKVIQKLHIF